jgi:hypothetical protein
MTPECTFPSPASHRAEEALPSGQLSLTVKAMAVIHRYPYGIGEWQRGLRHDLAAEPDADVGIYFLLGKNAMSAT